MGPLLNNVFSTCCGRGSMKSQERDGKQGTDSGAGAVASAKEQEVEKGKKSNKSKSKNKGSDKPVTSGNSKETTDSAGAQNDSSSTVNPDLTTSPSKVLDDSSGATSSGAAAQGCTSPVDNAQGKTGLFAIVLYVV
jgi:hypothetical protein